MLPLPLAHGVVSVVMPVQTARHVLQPRLPFWPLAGAFDWYWLDPQLRQAVHTRLLLPLPLAHAVDSKKLPVHADRQSLQPRSWLLVGAVDWYWLCPQLRQGVHTRLLVSLPLAHAVDSKKLPVHADRHVLQLRLRVAVGDVDWYWLLPQLLHVVQYLVVHRASRMPFRLLPMWSEVSAYTFPERRFVQSPSLVLPFQNVTSVPRRCTFSVSVLA